MSVNLHGISETLLIPLWARAVETGRREAIIRDPVAVDWLERLDYDFSRFETAWMSQVAVAVRTMILDQEVGLFLKHNPNAVIINLGAGLDTRFFRLDNGQVHWYDLDLPEVVELKSELCTPPPHYEFIAGSVLESAWMDEIPSTDRRILIMAEGLLLYFEEERVREVFQRLLSRFPRADLLATWIGPAFVGRAKIENSVKQLPGVEFLWSPKDSRIFEAWDARIRFVQEWYLTDYHRNRWRWMGQVTRLGFLKRRLSNRIVHLRFQ
jgi:O-methyltransferase involved in polyketide biosynthesis